MAKKRRMGAEDSKVRTQLITAAAELLSTEGYTSFSARKVGARAGITPQLLYYYFQTMDDLLLAVLRSFNEIRLSQFQEALESAEPLRKMWELNFDSSTARLFFELTTIASHNEKIRNEMIESAERFRRMQIEAVDRLISGDKNDEDRAAATEVLMIAFALGRLLVTEQSLGFTTGHRESLDFIERMLARYEP